MATRDTNRIEIVETKTELWADQRVRWWFEFSTNAIRLEAINTSSDEIDIITPTSNDRVALDGGVWRSGSLERSMNVAVKSLKCKADKNVDSNCENPFQASWYVIFFPCFPIPHPVPTKWYFVSQLLSPQV